MQMPLVRPMLHLYSHLRCPQPIEVAYLALPSFHSGVPRAMLRGHHRLVV